MKVALCFIISYDHILNKEDIWREWIEPNKDIINVYFYYKDLKKIKSQWIMEHTIPPNYIHETSYYHVIPAYISLMQFSLSHDKNNQWICMLTDACCPIISPRRFRYLFYNYYNKSIMSWKKAWWNINFHKRGNLAMLPKDLHLANDPWFVLKRENVMHILNFVNKQKEVTKIICNGELANESLFAIILYGYNQLSHTEKKISDVISAVTHIADWSRMKNGTSPHTFKEANKTDIQFLEDSIEKYPCAIFIRKIDPEFPNDILKHYIYNYNIIKDNELVIKEPLWIIYRRLIAYLWILLYYVTPLIFLFYGFTYLF